MRIDRFLITPLSVAPSADQNSVRKLLYLVVFVVLGAVTLSPLLCVQVPPLVDYPNHLARMWILVHGTDIAELANNYSVDWRILPNLAMDLVVPVLARVMPIEEAGRVFVALTMLTLVGGTVTLHRVIHERPAIWPLCSVLFIYNAALYWGFTNYLFATGVYLFAFSGWIATRRWRPTLRILTFSAVASLLVLLHLFAFGLYGLSVVSYELARQSDLRRMSLRKLVAQGIIYLQFVPGVLLWYHSLGQGRSMYTAYGDLVFKFYALISPFTFGFEPTAFDWFTMSCVSLFLVLSIVSRSLKWAPQMRLPVAVMTALVLLIPTWLSGSFLADIRLPVALPFVFIASTRFEPVRKATATPVVAIALILLGVRVWSVSQAWRDYDRWFVEFRTASAVISPGARLLVVSAPISEQDRRLFGVPATLAKLQWPIFIHMAALAVIDRAAFFPYMFTGFHSIKVTPRNEAVSQAVAVPMTPVELTMSADPEQAGTLYTAPNFLGERPYWRNWPETFDFVLWMDFSNAPKPQLKQLQLLVNRSFFDIYRVVRP